MEGLEASAHGRTRLKRLTLSGKPKRAVPSIGSWDQMPFGSLFMMPLQEVAATDSMKTV